MRLHRARGSAELREVVSGYVTKADSLGKEQLGKLGEEEDEEEEPAIEWRRE